MTPPAGHEVVALHAAYEPLLLQRFYNDILEPCFGMYPDELDDLESFHAQLTQSSHDSECLYHILLLLDKEGRSTILAGVCFEYYRRSNCGLVTYIATNPNVDTKGQGLGRYLTDNALRTLHDQARRHGHPKCRAVFLESNSDEVVNDVMPPARRRQLLTLWGLSFLEFDYVQPRLSEERDACKTLRLAVFNDALVETPGVGFGLPSRDLVAFLTDFYTVLMGSVALTCDPDAIRQLAWLQTHPTVQVEKRTPTR
ncbi:hypothetical protein H310_13550 [Aphanomyces invadans]|uniref:N-acetyltransferase domain-containing protein n=1 Tax=Aphanomyces invadans TaxID=157072 RepID=A0A024TCY7_9STRA|nr:hypothetical protein H310_13550 [Aphanomyces invadans]ETV92025.1 hypothetical protein H310_13550 [Aphanomyces invadans]|eukprot:XP_008879322.1 hypothetical protein H310_13550 [Aphanomyces invadans]